MKKFNNKILILTFVVLAGIFALTKIFREPGRKSNLDASLFEIDTAQVSEIRLQPRKDSAQVTLKKTDSGWVVFASQQNGKAAPREISNLLASLGTLKPQRIITRKKEKWDQYEVNDSAAVVVKALDGDDELLELKLGKESAGVTYARVANDEEVYALEGYLHDVFDRKASAWRDQTFLELTVDKITKIEFKYPADSAFVLELKNGKWMADNELADSVKVQDYLSRVRSVEHDLFTGAQPSGEPTAVMIIEHGGGEIIVKGWRKSFDEWVLQSSVQPDAWFLDRGPKLAKDIFVGKKELQRRSGQ